MIEAQDVYEQFCQGWSKISHDLSWEGSSKPWTKRILQYLFDEGEKRGFKVYTNTNVIKQGQGEYIVDLCWSRGDERDYTGLELALESEWGPSEKEIMGDFYKLIDIKSYLKIMVISRDEDKINEIIKKMSKAVSDGEIKIAGEQYLIIIFSKDKKRQKEEQIGISGFQIDNNGDYNHLQNYRFADGISA